MKHHKISVRHAISIALIVIGLISLDKSNRQSYASVADQGNISRVREAYGRLPLRFEANAGQTASEVKFTSRGNGYALFLTQDEAVMALSKGKNEAKTRSVVRMKLAGANRAPQLEGTEALSGKSNYFIGNAPNNWRQNVASYGKVRYRSVYPGIDLIYYGNQQQLEYDFVVAPGADPNVIKLDFDGVKQMRVGELGDLVLNTGEAEVRQKKAVTYQEMDGQRQEIETQYILGENGQVGFKVGEYDRSRPLVIDPVLNYATFIGGESDEKPSAIDIDAAGNAYITGYTYSLNFPTKNPLDESDISGLTYAFVAKLNPDGSDLVFSTYLNGDSSASGSDIAVDGAGNVWVTGWTVGGNFPTVNPLQPTNAGVADIFVTKLKGDGSAILFSTYLGGSGSDNNGSLKVDRQGDILLTGYTTSTNFPTVNAFQPAHANSILIPCPPFPSPFPCVRLPYSGSEDAFVAKLKGDGSALVFSTYLGGSRGDDGQDLAVDGNGNIYVIGVTGSLDFPTANPLQAANAGSNSNAIYDAFVAKFNANGALVYSTYFGGSSNDFGRSISLDGSGNVYLLGQTYSPNFPMVAPLKSTLSGSTDLFVTELNQTGSTIRYSTYLGGNESEEAGELKVDAQGNAYITGETKSTDFPTVNAIQSTLNPGGPCTVFIGVVCPDAVVAKLGVGGASLVYSTYLGGSCFDVGTAIAIDSVGSAYVAGWTFSDNFPITPRAFQQTLAPRSQYGGPIENFILKIDNR
jgi:beta-propeller repeat-containing protein